MADAELSSSFHKMTLHSGEDREVKRQAKANKTFFVQFSPSNQRLPVNPDRSFDISKKDTTQVVGILEELLNTQWIPGTHFFFFIIFERFGRYPYNVSSRTNANTEPTWKRNCMPLWRESFKIQRNTPTHSAKLPS